MVNTNATTPQLEVLQNYIHETFPKSIGLPDETKEEYTKSYIKRYEEMLSSFTMIETTIHEVIEAPGKVVFHATTVCETAFGTVSNDSITILSFVEEDGELKVLRSKEFTDPQQYNTFYDAKAAVERVAAP